MGFFNWDYSDNLLNTEEQNFVAYLKQAASNLDNIPHTLKIAGRVKTAGKVLKDTPENKQRLEDDFKQRQGFCAFEKSKKTPLGKKAERYGDMFAFKANELVALGRQLTALITKTTEQLAKTEPGNFQNFLTQVLAEAKQKQQLLADLMLEEYVMPAQNKKSVDDHLVANQVKGQQQQKFPLPVVPISTLISKQAKNPETLLQFMQKYSDNFSPMAIFQQAKDLFNIIINQFTKGEVLFDQAQINERFLAYQQTADQLAETPFEEAIKATIESTKTLAIATELMPQIKAEKEEILEQLDKISTADILEEKHTAIANQVKAIYEQPLNNLRTHLEEKLLTAIKAKWQEYPDKIPDKGLDENLPVVKIYQATLVFINTAIAPLLDYDPTQANKNIKEALKTYQTIIESVEKSSDASEEKNQTTIELAKQLLEATKKFQQLQDINSDFKSYSQIIENQLNTVSWVTQHCGETLANTKASWANLQKVLSTSLNNLANQPSSNLANTSIVLLNNATFNLMTAFFKQDTTANNIEDRVKQLRTAIVTYEATLTEINNEHDTTVTAQQIQQAQLFKESIANLTDTLEKNTLPAVFSSNLQHSITSINNIASNIPFHVTDLLFSQITNMLLQTL